jgi:hypothetical protein
MYRHSFLAVLLITELIMCFLPLHAAAEETAIAPAQEEARTITNLTIEVSSQHHRLNIPDHMVDGDLTNRDKRWISALGDEEPWVMFILSEAAKVDAVVLYSGLEVNRAPEKLDPYVADTFVIEYMEGSDWVEAARVSGNKDYRCAVRFAPATADIWRIRFIVPNTYEAPGGRRARLFEVRLLSSE